MAVLKTKDGKELHIDCRCGNDEGIRFRINSFDDFSHYCLMTYTNGHFYREQDDRIWKVLYKKLKKIWAIIRNKDFYYSEIVMNKEEFNEFRDYLNSIK